MTSGCDDRAPLVRILGSAEYRCVFLAQPSRITVELMVPQRVTGHQMYVMAFLEETKGDMARRNATADDHDLLGSGGPVFKSGFEYMLDSWLIAWSPFRPLCPIA